MLDLTLRSDTARARSRVEAALVRFPLVQMPSVGRPYLSLALFFALSGDPTRSRALLAEYQATEPAELQQGARGLVNQVQGAIQLAETRPEEAIALLRASDTGGCSVCVLPLLGSAYEQAGRTSEARTTYDRFLELTWPDRAAPWPARVWDGSGDAFWLVHVLERLLAMDALAGNAEAAAARWTRITELWALADPELDGRVDAAQRRARGVAPGL
jgi:tetratricopeptide (TPR) repeat protein